MLFQDSTWIMLSFWQGIYVISGFFLNFKDSAWILVLYIIIWFHFDRVHLLQFWIVVSFCDLEGGYESDIYIWELWIVVYVCRLSSENSTSSWESTSSHTHSYAFWQEVHVISRFYLNYALILPGSTCYFKILLDIVLYLVFLYMFITYTSIYVYRIIMYITLQNLRNMAKSKKIVATLDCVVLKSIAIEYEKQRYRNIEENNRVLQQLGIPPITTTLGGKNDLKRRQSSWASDEDGDYMPLEDEGPDNEAGTATKASTIRTRGNRRQADDVLLSPSLLSNWATSLTFSSP